MRKELPLKELWNKKNARFCDYRGCEIVSNFGYVEKEYHELKQGSGIIDVSYREKIIVSGYEHVAFLNNILSNDIKNLREKQACLAALLSAQGRTLSFMTVYKGSDFILLDVEPGVAGPTIELIDKYIITEDVSLQDITGEYIHLISPRPFPKEALLDNKNILTYQIKNGSAILYESLIPKEYSEDIVQKILENKNISPVGFKAFEAFRIEAGIPRHLVDFDETVTLPETGLDKIAASETKGCYPGQEVVAKMNTYKGWPKRLIAFKVASDAKIGDNLTREGKSIGRISSYSDESKSALGYIAKPYYDESNLRLKVGGSEKPEDIIPRIPGCL